MAEGNIIAFLDSDDLWTRDKLEKQMKLMEILQNFDDKPLTDSVYNDDVYNEKSGRSVLLYTGSDFITSKDVKLGYTLRVPKKIGRKELQKQNIISCSSVLASKELLMKHVFPIIDDPIHEDFVVWIEILKEIPYAYGIDEPLLIYRISDSSKSSRKSRAAVMNWNTYRYVGMGILESIYYMVCYTIRGLKKWSRIKAQIK